MFKVGDRVKYIGRSHNRLTHGKIYKILELSKRENGDIVWLRFLDDAGRKDGWLVDNFKLLKESTKETDWLDQIQLNFKEGI